MHEASEALIAMVSRHIAEGDIRVSAQMERIDRLKRYGLGAADAEKFLETFRASLRSRNELLRMLTHDRDQ